jgi:YhcH/YjgK/YiaL family protein
MIYDQIKNMASYKGVSKNFDAAIDWFLKNDATKLPDGKHSVAGTDAVIAQISHRETKDATNARFEAHKKYIDIQIILEGKEYCYYQPAEGLEPDGEYIHDRDVIFFKGGENICSFLLEPGMFAVFFPQDAHKPSCDFNGKRSTVHRSTLKVLV